MNKQVVGLLGDVDIYIVRAGMCAHICGCVCVCVTESQ
jgi:hypothetical protein